jgi:hypothetical protein
MDVEMTTLQKHPKYVFRTSHFPLVPTRRVGTRQRRAASQHRGAVQSAFPRSAWERARSTRRAQFLRFVQDFRDEGLICFNLQAIVPQCFFVEQFLSETSDFMFQRFLRSKLKHGV